MIRRKLTAWISAIAMLMSLMVPFAPVTAIAEGETTTLAEFSALYQKFWNSDRAKQSSGYLDSTTSGIIVYAGIAQIAGDDVTVKTSWGLDSSYKVDLKVYAMPLLDDDEDGTATADETDAYYSNLSSTPSMSEDSLLASITDYNSGSGWSNFTDVALTASANSFSGKRAIFLVTDSTGKGNGGSFTGNFQSLSISATGVLDNPVGTCTVPVTVTSQAAAEASTEFTVALKYFGTTVKSGTVTLPAGAKTASATLSDVTVYNANAEYDVEVTPANDDFVVAADSQTTVVVAADGSPSVAVSVNKTAEDTVTLSSSFDATGKTSADIENWNLIDLAVTAGAVETDLKNSDIVKVEYDFVPNRNGDTKPEGRIDLRATAADTSGAVAGSNKYSDYTDANRFFMTKINSSWNQTDVISGGQNGFSGASNIDGKQLLNASGNYVSTETHHYTYTIDYANKKLSIETVGPTSKTFEFTDFPSVSKGSLYMALYPDATTTKNIWSVSNVKITYKKVIDAVDPENYFTLPITVSQEAAAAAATYTVKAKKNGAVSGVTTITVPAQRTGGTGEIAELDKTADYTYEVTCDNADMKIAAAESGEAENRTLAITAERRYTLEHLAKNADDIVAYSNTSGRAKNINSVSTTTAVFANNVDGSAKTVLANPKNSANINPEYIAAYRNYIGKSGDANGTTFGFPISLPAGEYTMYILSCYGYTRTFTTKIAENSDLSGTVYKTYETTVAPTRIDDRTSGNAEVDLNTISISLDSDVTGYVVFDSSDSYMNDLYAVIIDGKPTAVNAVYDITLNANGGSYADGYTAPATYTAGTGVTLPTSEQISKDDYTFDGWFDNEELTGTAVAEIGTDATGNKTYYAKWTQTSPVATTEPTAEPTTEPTTEPTAEPTIAPTPAATATAVPAPEATATAVPAPEATATAVPAPEATATTVPAPEATATTAPAPAVTATPAPTAEATAEPTEATADPTEATADPTEAPSGSVLYVNADYTDAEINATHFKSIRDAVAAARIINPQKESDRITINVYPGNYEEQVRIDGMKYLTLQQMPETSGKVNLNWYFCTGYYTSNTDLNGLYDPKIDWSLDETWNGYHEGDEKFTKYTIGQDLSGVSAISYYDTDGVAHKNVAKNSMLDRLGGLAWSYDKMAPMIVTKSSSDITIKDFNIVNSTVVMKTKGQEDGHLTPDPSRNLPDHDALAICDESTTPVKPTADIYGTNGGVDYTKYKAYVDSQEDGFKFTEGESAWLAQSSLFNERGHAIAILGDRVICENVRVRGNQDSVWVSDGRTYFKNCDLIGGTDYIYGSAATVFDSCKLGFEGFIDYSYGSPLATPNTPASRKYGYLFLNCTIYNVRNNNGVNNFGGAWGEYGQSTFYNTTLDDNADIGASPLKIDDKGWGRFGAENGLSRLYEYGTKNNSGAAVDLSKRIVNLSEEEGGTGMGTVLDKWQILEFNPRNVFSTKNDSTWTDSWDPMNFNATLADVDAQIAASSINVPAGNETEITLPVPSDDNIEFHWESKSTNAVVNETGTTMTVTRPAYGEEPIETSVTLYARDKTTGYGDKAEIPITIAATTDSVNVFSIPVTITASTASAKNSNYTVTVSKEGLLIKQQTITLAKGEKTVTEAITGIPASAVGIEYDVEITSGNSDFTITVPENGVTTVMGVTGVPAPLSVTAQKIVDEKITTDIIASSTDNKTVEKFDLITLAKAKGAEDSIMTSDIITVGYTLTVNQDDSTSGNSFIDILSGTPADTLSQSGVNSRFVLAKLGHWNQLDMVDSAQKYSGSSNGPDQWLNATGKFTKNGEPAYVTVTIDYKNQTITATGQGTSALASYSFDTFPTTFEKGKLNMAVYFGGEAFDISDVYVTYKKIDTTDEEITGGAVYYYRGNNTDITGGNQCDNTAVYKFVDGVDEKLAALFADEDDSTKIKADIIPHYKNYISGTSSSGTHPQISLTADAGEYKIYYLGYNYGNNITASVGGKTLTAGEGVNFAYQSDNASRVLKLYTIDMTLENDVTNETITFDSTDQWLPDLYAIVVAEVVTPKPTTAPTTAPTGTPEATTAPTTAPTGTPETTTAPTTAPTGTPETTTAPTTAPTGTPEATTAPTTAPTGTPEATTAPTAEPGTTPSPEYLELLKPFDTVMKIEKKTDEEADTIELTATQLTDEAIPEIKAYVALYDGSALAGISVVEFDSDGKATIQKPSADNGKTLKIFVWTDKFEPVIESLK